MSTIPWWANSILTTVLAIAVAWVAISFDRRKTVNQELIRKRIAVYDQMAPMLNDILCFFRCIGDFKNLPPDAIIDHKRDLDRARHVYQPIFSAALKARYDEFMALCFVAYRGGVSRPALIRANAKKLSSEWGAAWKVAWNRGFVGAAERSSLDAVQRGYDALMDQFAVELGAGRRGNLGSRS